MHVSFLLRRLLRREEGLSWGPLHTVPQTASPTPRQGALQAPWNPILKSYPGVLDRCFSRGLVALTICYNRYACHSKFIDAGRANTGYSKAARQNLDMDI